MPVQQFGREAQFAADGANFVLIKGRERLDDAAFVDQLLNPGDAVVMGLDQVGLGGAAGFDGVGVNGALAENPAGRRGSARFENALLHLDELLADDVALSFGIGDALRARLRNCCSACVDLNALAPSARNCAHEFGLAFAHQAGVDVGAVNTRRVRGRAEAQRVGDGGIDASADEEKYVAIARGGADVIFDRRESGRPGPSRCSQPQMSKMKFDRIVSAARRVRHFGMKLHGVKTARGRGNGRDGAGFGAGQTSKPSGGAATVSRWLIQTCWRPFDAAKHAVGGSDFELREAVFAVGRLSRRGRPADAPSTAGRSRCPARECRSEAERGSMVGLPGS